MTAPPQLVRIGLAALALCGLGCAQTAAPPANPGPTVVIERPGQAGAAQAELSSITSAGLITAVRCHDNTLDLTLQVGNDVYTLHTDDYRAVPFGGAATAPVAPCTGVAGKRARVEFKPSPDAAERRGTLVSVRLLP